MVTMLSMLIGMIIMLIIASNLTYMMGRSSVTGGIYAYTKEAFGRDHAFLSSWFLCLSYLTIAKPIDLQKMMDTIRTVLQRDQT